MRKTVKILILSLVIFLIILIATTTLFTIKNIYQSNRQLNESVSRLNIKLDELEREINNQLTKNIQYEGDDDNNMTAGIRTDDMYLPYDSFTGFSLEVDTNDGNFFTIIHRTNHKVISCSMSGLKEPEPLVDFKLTIRHYRNQSIENVFKTYNSDSDKLLKDEKLTENKNVGIDSVVIGKYKGYSFYKAVEGCGVIEYYLKTDDGILYIENEITDVFNPIREDYKENLELEGIIDPSTAFRLFNQIVESIEIKD